MRRLHRTPMARPLRSLSALGTIRREIKELSRGGGTPPLTSRTQNYVVVWLLEVSLGPGHYEGWGPRQASSLTSSCSRGTTLRTKISPILDVAVARLGYPGQLLPPRPQQTEVPEVERCIFLPHRERRGAHLWPVQPSQRPGHTCALYSHYSFS